MVKSSQLHTKMSLRIDFRSPTELISTNKLYIRLIIKVKYMRTVFQTLDNASMTLLAKVDEISSALKHQPVNATVVYHEWGYTSHWTTVN